jgi:hypothetical protein
LNPRTGPGTRWDLGQKGQTKRVPCAFGMRSTITPHPGLHSLYSTGSGGTITGFRFARTGLAATFGACFFATRLGRERFTEALVRRAAAVLLVLDERAALVAITSALAGPLCDHCPDSPSVTTARYSLKLFSAYFLRSTMFLSVRLLLRVFLPSVGKAHGVWG